VTVSWTGKGTATLERWRNPANGRGNLRSITVDGSDAASGLTIATTGQKVDTVVEAIIVHGPIGTLAAATTDLLGLLDVQGTLVKATFDEATGATIQIGGTPTSKPATLVFDQVRDTGILSGMPIASLKAAEWLDTDGILQEIEAPWIGTLSVAGKRTATPKVAGETEAYIDSNVSGETLGTVVLRDVRINNVANAGADFGVTGQRIASYTRWQGKVAAKKASNLAGTRVIEQTGDYIFQLI